MIVVSSISVLSENIYLKHLRVEEYLTKIDHY